MRALVVQHEQPTPGGYVHQWLEERGAHQETYRIDVEDRVVDPRDYQMIVSLGSEFAAFDDSVPWLSQGEAASARRDGARCTRPRNLLRRSAPGPRPGRKVIPK